MPLDLVRERSPERPVALVRPDAVALAAHWFQANFKGDVLYAVKANPSPWVIETLFANGVAAFDVASIPEVELVKTHAPGARLAFMHPVKSRSAIAQAYFDFGVRTFAFDALEELDKILDVTGQAKDLNLIVRRGRMEGFIVTDYMPRAAEAIGALAGWVQAGKLKNKVDVQHGLENAPETLRRLFEGRNEGKQLLRVAE